MWLLAPDELARLGKLAESEAYINAAAEFARRGGEIQAARSGYSSIGATAKIDVIGALSEKPTLMSILMGGGSTYAQISADLTKALSDSSVKAIQLYVDSPGGQVSGLFELMDKIKAASQVKPITVLAARAQSAAYGIAAASGGKIYPTSSGAVFGSIGVAASYQLDDSVVTLTSDGAPDKRPDLTTEEGKAKVVAELNQNHDLFVSYIAEGRGYARGEKLTGASITSNYGKGGSMLAAQAFEAGLIDAKPQTTKRRVMSAASFDGEKKKMKFSEYAAAHPEEASAALESARKDETKRCSAHIKLAQKSGAWDAAAAAIIDGLEASDPTVLFEHVEHGMKAKAHGERAAVSEEVEGKITESGVSAKEKDMGDIIAEMLYGKVEA